MPSILHISDVHFGPPHIAERSAAVLAMAERRRPDLVVIAGDLTQRAKPHQFRQARRFVDGFSMPTVTVPGNHDVPLYRVWERVFAPLGAYRKHFAADTEPVYRGETLFVVGVNTAHGWTFTDGRIHLRRLAEIGELLERAPDGAVKVVVAHHHLIPPPRFGTQRVLANAYEAVELFSQAGVELVLSGHQHQSFIASSEEFFPFGRPPFLILHSGTTTSRRGRGWERRRNTCFWIEIEPTEFAISRLRWEPELERFATMSEHRYPRAANRPYSLHPAAPQAPAAD